MKTVEVEGGVSGQVALRDIHNHVNHGRALIQQERIELNRAVKQIEELGGDPGWKTWQYLHQVIGVKSVEEMRIDHRDAALAILGLLLQIAALQGGDATKLRAERDSLVQRLAEESALRQALLKRHEVTVLSAERHEKAATTATYHLRQAQSELTEAKSRAGKPHALIGFLLVSAALAGLSYSQWSRARDAEALLRLCAFEGKGYGVGSLLNTSPPRECVRAGDGQVAWAITGAKPKRSR